MADRKRPDANQVPADLPIRKHRGDFGTWLRYNWWKILLHVFLISFGVLNIYPFFWMLGTSFKAEAEASSDRLRPWPVPKYKLAEGFDSQGIIPPFLIPRDANAPAGEDRVNLAIAKMEALQELQRDAFADNVENRIAILNTQEDHGFEQAKRVVDAQEETLTDLRRKAARLKHDLEAYRKIDTLRERRDRLARQVAAAGDPQEKARLAEEVALLVARIEELEQIGPGAKRQLQEIRRLIGRGKEKYSTLKKDLQAWKDALQDLKSREMYELELPPWDVLDRRGPKAVTTRPTEVADVPPATQPGQTPANPTTRQADLPAEPTTQPARVPPEERLILRWQKREGKTSGPTARMQLDTLLKKGFLTRDESRNSYWLGEQAEKGILPEGLTAKQQRIAREVRKHFLMTPKAYNQVTKVEVDDARRQMLSLSQGPKAALAEVPPSKGADAKSRPAYVLLPWARGAVYHRLLPRQILTMLYMTKEDQRRSESRTTFATDRWSPGDYQKNYGLPTEQQGREEILSLVDRGMMTEGQFQAINYWVVLKEENLLLNFLTSLLITGTVVLLTVLISSMLGYALARIRFPGKFLVLGIMIAASVLPGEARIIPIFKMLMAVGLMKNLWGVVLWLTSFGVGNALLMAGFFLTLPKEVDEAAEVDGAGVFRKFFDIALPMARPIVMTVGLFAFLMAWNNFLIPLLCTISRPSMQPLAVAVYNFQQGHPGKWHQINAAAAVMIVPVILMFLLVQKHVVRSIAVGAVKG
ncbi:MAG: ABC transporter permease subunit [Phycisphaerae bacterium]